MQRKKWNETSAPGVDQDAHCSTDRHSDHVGAATGGAIVEHRCEVRMVTCPHEHFAFAAAEIPRCDRLIGGPNVAYVLPTIGFKPAAGGIICWTNCDLAGNR
jgi:hypothetical protein